MYCNLKRRQLAFFQSIKDSFAGIIVIIQACMVSFEDIDVTIKGFNVTYKGFNVTYKGFNVAIKGINVAFESVYDTIE